MEHRSHHAGVDCSLLYIAGDAGHKGIPVFKVGVKISLRKERGGSERRTRKTCEQPRTMLSGGDWACTWYMIEEGGGSMHGCWSGRGSSSSRSTLDRASSRVTWVVMVTRCHSQKSPFWQKQRKSNDTANWRGGNKKSEYDKWSGVSRVLRSFSLVEIRKEENVIKLNNMCGS